MEPWMSDKRWVRNCAGRRGAYVLPSAALSLLGFYANAETPPSPDPGAHLDTITVEAAREHEKLARQVSKFVSTIAVARENESLANWQREIPICPLVAGLPRGDGEYVLSKISSIAAAAGAPLAAENCKPNLFVVVTSEPDALLKAWSKRDVRLYENGDDHGGVDIRKFLDDKAPVRAWYNAELYSRDGTPIRYSGGDGVVPGARTVQATATRIRFNAVRDLASVIVLIDAPRARGVSFGQLAAYISMVGLAQIKVGARVSDTPSILQLFSADGKSAPAGLTEWDQAFLKGLYHTEHLDQRQISEVKTSMIRDIARTQ
jgi:hypothetical protein